MSDTREIERFYCTALKNKIEAEGISAERNDPLNIINLCNNPPNFEHSLTAMRLGKAESAMNVSQTEGCEKE